MPHIGVSWLHYRNSGFLLVALKNLRVFFLIFVGFFGVESSEQNWLARPGDSRIQRGSSGEIPGGVISEERPV